MAKEPDVGGCDRMAPSGAIRRLCAKCCRPCFFRGTENDSSGAEVCVIRLAAGSLCQEIRTPGRGAGPGKEKKELVGKPHSVCSVRPILSMQGTRHRESRGLATSKWVCVILRIDSRRSR